MLCCFGQGGECAMVVCNIGKEDEMNPDRYVCVEGGRKPFYDVRMATERKCCDCT